MKQRFCKLKKCAPTTYMCKQCGMALYLQSCQEAILIEAPQKKVYKHLNQTTNIRDKYVHRYYDKRR